MNVFCFFYEYIFFDVMNLARIVVEHFSTQR